MTFDQIREELRIVRRENILSPVEEELIPILLELVTSVESVHKRIQELALAQTDNQGE